MYQPKMKEHLICKLYFLAKRRHKKMTHVLNEILEEYLVTEPEPPPYEPQWRRYQPRPDAAKRKEHMIHTFFREYHAGGPDEEVSRQENAGDRHRGGGARRHARQEART